MAQVIENVTGAVLAGGRSRRFGSTKALAPWAGGTLVSHAAGVLAGLFPELLVVVKEPSRIGEIAGARVVADLSEEHHALGGILTALSRAGSPYVFVCACDMPFLSRGLIAALCAAAEGRDAVVPVWGGLPQPLCAVYSQTLRGPIAEMIAAGSLRVRDLLPRVRARFFSEDEVRPLDPAGRSFLDLDTWPAYAAALREVDHD